ncbi:unnamed protein product, partial [Nesidiocoris tenuis]
MELNEATKKLQMSGNQGAANEASRKEIEQLRRALEEAGHQAADYKKKMDEQKRAIESRTKDLDEKERGLIDLEMKLKKRKEQGDVAASK